VPDAPPNPTLEQLTDVVVTMARAVDAVLREQQALSREVRGLRHDMLGEVRALDARVAVISEDVRVLRVLRDGLTALAADVDVVRQLASQAASSKQMAEISGQLSSLLGEIEMARAQVLQLERAPEPEPEHDDAVEQLAQRVRRMSDTARRLGNDVLRDLRSRKRKHP
jgi:hypothetical protein